MIDRDKILVEATRTRRQRLMSALTFGGLPDRRTVTDNIGRFVGSAVLAAAIGAGCLGGSVMRAGRWTMRRLMPVAPVRPRAAPVGRPA